MRILIGTPLYPPDVAESALYVKEAARRLAKTETVSILSYGMHPELIPGVRIVPVNKHQPLIVRLTSYTFALWRFSRKADILYIQNGASVELPLRIVAALTHIPIVFHIADAGAHERALATPRLRVIERNALAAAQKVIKEHPSSRPEILPFEPYPTEALAAWERAWEEHVAMLRSLFEKLATKP